MRITAEIKTLDNHIEFKKKFPDKEHMIKRELTFALAKELMKTIEKSPIGQERNTENGTEITYRLSFTLLTKENIEDIKDKIEELKYYKTFFPGNEDIIKSSIEKEKKEKEREILLGT